MKNFKHWMESNHNILSGWLAPCGKFYECKRNMFDHLGVIRDTPEIRNSMPDWFEEKIKELEERKEAHQNLMRNGEHPGDSYDVLHDSIEEAAYDEMYKRGYLRVSHQWDDVFFQGTSNGIKNLYNKAKDMAEEHGKKASFEKASV